MKDRNNHKTGGKKDLSDFFREDTLQRIAAFEEGLSRLAVLMEPESGVRKSRLADMEFLSQSLTQDLCRKCPKYRECYGEKKEETAEEIASILEQAYGYSGVDGYMASDGFRKKCIYFQPFVEELTWLFRLIYQNHYWENRFVEMKRVMRKQIEEQKRFLRECQKRIVRGTPIAGKKKAGMKKIFLKKGILFLEGKEYVDENKMMEVTVFVRPLFGARKVESVKRCLNTYYGKNFYRNREEIWLRPGINRGVFTEENNFHVLFGKKCCNKKGEDVCGDTFSFTKFGKKRAVMLLSDGMGTGEVAFADSRKLIETLEDLLETGISEEFAVEMVHDALLFRDRGEFSTIDAVVLSLQTGMLKLLKAGGTATFIRHGNTQAYSVERIMPETLPPGSRIDQRFDLTHRKLYDGDMVIMVSDGMLEFENMPEIPFRMEDLIKKIPTDNAQVLAQRLMDAVPVAEDGHDDDRTVLTAAIWEKRRSERNV